ncbi:MAG: polysaccharide deacetylase family protein [Cyanobacteria bacterium CRU_2_1]|nr:polysaccharide deacetylase family protein [Cyanobacteria bacterium RU_5_0]NJR63795.1 polysaccharide deacetylase family protein [Cyanobacteria bacterium CRU_2_1]
MQFAPLYPLLHKILKPTFPNCLWSGRSDSPTIALTFDDGPHPLHTLQLLKVLDRHQIQASFFWLGVQVERYPDIAREVWQRGHWVGLHGYHHYSFPRLSAVDLKQSLLQTQAAIAQACQLDPAYVQAYIRDVRPPNGIFTPQTLQCLKEWQYRPVMWSIVPEDWVRPGINIVRQRVLTQAQNGSVIVLHDGYFGGEDVAETADRLIPTLQERGYDYVTIDRLWQQLQK